MNPTGRRFAAVAIAAGVSALTGLGSRISWAPDATDAILRLSWRARSERTEVCRHRTAEEIEKLPAHMREDEVCERRLLPYRLRLTVDSRLVVDEVIRAAGARQDRPLYVFREQPLPPGRHRIGVLFERQGTTPAEPSETHREEHGTARTAPPRLALDTTMTFRPGRIILLTYDEDSQQLRIRTSPQ